MAAVVEEAGGYDEVEVVVGSLEDVAGWVEDEVTGPVVVGPSWKPSLFRPEP